MCDQRWTLKYVREIRASFCCQASYWKLSYKSGKCRILIKTFKTYTEMNLIIFFFFFRKSRKTKMAFSNIIADHIEIKSRFIPSQLVQTFAHRIYHTTYIRANHPRTLRISLVRRKFRSNRFFPKTHFLKRLIRRCLLDRYDQPLSILDKLYALNLPKDLTRNVQRSLIKIKLCAVSVEVTCTNV